MTAGLRYDYILDPQADTSGARLVRLVGRDKRVLDLGCAAGALARVLVQRGCSVVGWDIDREAAKIAEGVCERVIVADLDVADLEVELGDDRFDAIVAGDVFEHLREPAAVLRGLLTFLRPGGYLVLSVPNVAHGSVRLALLHGDFPRSETGLLDDTHRQFLTRATLLDLLDAGGWVPVHVEATRLDPRASEVPFPDDEMTRKVLADVEADPDAWVYQFIALAFPAEADGLDALPALAQQLSAGMDERVARLSRELDASMLHTRNLEAEVTLRDGRMDDLRGQLEEQRQAQADTERAADQALGEARLDLLRARDAAFRQERRYEWLRNHVENREAEIVSLREHVRRACAEAEEEVYKAEQKLEEIYQSRLWTMATRYRRVVGLLKGRSE